MKPLFVHAEWDEETHVWVTTSDDVPGLTTEEKIVEALVHKPKIMNSELLEANGFPVKFNVPFEVMTHWFELIKAPTL